MTDAIMGHRQTNSATYRYGKIEDKIDRYEWESGKECKLIVQG